MRKRDNVLRRIEQSQSRHMVVLRTPHFRDELARIVGDREVPYKGVLSAGSEATDRTAPTAEDRVVIESLCRGSSSSSSSSGTATPKLTVHFGDYAVDAWYRGVYPNEPSLQYVFVCPFCLVHKPNSDLAGERHLRKCERLPPPGSEIYRDGRLSVWQVDGERASLYCQNLCMLAKLFLASKQLYREVQSFFFYVLTERDGDADGDGHPRFVGYFSKQKAFDIYKLPQPVQALSCIFTVPTVQHQGYGQFLIGLSYLLVRLQHNVGSPETPLSDLGRRAYFSYWKRTVCFMLRDLLAAEQPAVTIEALCTQSGMCAQHVALALEACGWLRHERTGAYRIVVDPQDVHERARQYALRRTITAVPERILCAPLYY